MEAIYLIGGIIIYAVGVATGLYMASQIDDKL